MTQRWARLAWLVGLLALCGAAPADADLRKLFPRTAALPAQLPEGTPLQLELPAEVLAACRPDLSDLRLLERLGGQVPFVIDRRAPDPLAAARLQLRSEPATLLGAKHHESRSPNAPSVIEELYELRSPPPPPAGAAWQLVAESNAASFVREVAIQSGTLARPGAELARGSLFRLRDRHGERTQLPLPEIGARSFVVRLSGEAGTPLEPRWVFEAIERVPPPTAVYVPLRVREQRSEGSVQHFQLLRPAGIVTRALRVESLTPTFDRDVVVRNGGQGGLPGIIGRGHVFRLPASAAGAASSVGQLELPLQNASGEWLDVSMENGDSPPLEGLSFSAVITAPSLVFTLPPAPGHELQLYFGGGRAVAPRYDLERMLRPPGTAPLPPVPVTLGEARDNPAFDRTPLLEFALHAGAVVEEQMYARQRTLTITDAPDGLAKIGLDAADVAALCPDLRDMRVVDSAGRQWPYLLEQAGRVVPVPLAVGDASHSSRSRRALGLPVSPLAATALWLEPREGYFDRAYRILGQRDGGELIELASGHLTRARGSSGPLEIELRPERVRSLELEVQDGDNAPLDWSSARAQVALPDLYVLAPPGEYRLLLGNPAASAPSYDIERARELVLSVAGREQPLGPLLDNPSFRASARLAAGEGPTQLALWGALTLAVLVLGGLTLRMARQRTPD